MTIRRPLTLINGLLKLLPLGDRLPTADIGARVVRQFNQSIPSGLNTAIALSGGRYNASGIWTAGSSTRFTCNTAGKYLIGGCLSFAAGGTGIRQIAILLNGVTYIAAQQGPANATNYSICTVYNLAINDYLQMMAYQDSGAALDVASISAYSPEFYMQLLA